MTEKQKSNTIPSWGRMLTKKELLDLLARLDEKKKARKEK
jgi:hypothetical protein